MESSFDERRLTVGQRVRLLLDREGPTGSEGRIVGFYARTERTVLVAFGDVIVELEPAAVEPLSVPPT